MADLIRKTAELPAAARVNASETGLTIQGELPYEDWAELGGCLQRLSQAWQWWVGDWLSYGQDAYGEKYVLAVEASEVTGINTDTIRRVQFVAERVEPVRRRTKLSFSHHAEVASLDPEDQDALLGLAAENGWTVRLLREAVKEYKKAGEERRNGGAPPEGQGDAREAPQAPESSDPPPADPDPDQPEDDGEEEVDPVAEWEREMERANALEERLAEVTTDDTAAKIAELHEKYARLENRLQQEIRTRGEAEKEARYAKGKLKEVREALGVQRDREILPAIQRRQGAA